MIRIPYIAHIPFVLLFLGFALCFRRDAGGVAAALTMAKTLEWRSAAAQRSGAHARGESGSSVRR